MEIQMVVKTKTDPKDCEHQAIRRILNGWECSKCGAEFVPKDRKLKNPWRR